MKLLVTGAWKSAKEHIENLTLLGHVVVFMQDEQGEIPCNPQEIEGVICNALFLYHEIDQFTRLKFIQLTSAGYDRVPMNKVKERNINIFNARGVYSIPMAEYALWGLLSLYKRARFFENNRIKKKWVKHRGIPELYSKTVAIIGCGSVGVECAKRLKAMGCSLLGVDLFENIDKIFDKAYTIDDLDNVLSISDIVILTLPLTENTKGIFNKKRFSVMKESSVLINIARGGIVCQDCLIKAVKTRLFGAVIDVFESEPLEESSELWDLDNVIITPHNSFIGEANEERLSQVILANLERY